DGVFDLGRRVGVEVAKTAAEKWRAAHLPEQPGQAFGPRLAAGRQEGPELLGKVHQYRAGLEQPDRRRPAAIHQRWYLGIRIDRHKSAAELVAVDPDQPRIVFGTSMTSSQQLLKHHRDLDAIRRGQRVKLKRMTAYRQFLVMRWTGDRTIDAGKFAAALLVPGPDFGRHIGGRVGCGCIGHSSNSWLLS